jgi:nifR3 family TIM-barrel protein
VELVKELHKHPFVLAPMAGITDNAFRSFMKELGCGIVISELISAHGINYHSQKTLDLMKFEKAQSPVAIQLFGETPEAVAEAAKHVQDKGADFVDLNFGCPVKKVVSKGAGSAILKDLPALQKMVSTVKKAIEIPLTIKIRTGWDANTRNAIDVCNIAYNEGVTWVAIHGRTRSQGYEGLADWDYISEVKSKTKIPIIGNGDVHTPKQAVERLKSSGCDGVMIGRGCLKNPWIFSEALAILNQERTGEVQVCQLNKDFLLVLESLNHHLSRNFDDHLVGIQLKKFTAWFSAGYPGSAHFRKDIFQHKTAQDVFSYAYKYFESIKPLMQEDTSTERFLMGGHG